MPDAVRKSKTESCLEVNILVKILSPLTFSQTRPHRPLGSKTETEACIRPADNPHPRHNAQCTIRNNTIEGSSISLIKRIVDPTFREAKG